jgi:hypothetical protein
MLFQIVECFNMVASPLLQPYSIRIGNPWQGQHVGSKTGDHYPEELQDKRIRVASIGPTGGRFAGLQPA